MFGFYPLSGAPLSGQLLLGASSVFAGTASILLSQTSTLALGATFGSTSPITLAQTGAELSSAKFVGSSAITFGQSGLLTDGDTMLGNTPITIGQSGALKAAAKLAGSSPITIGQTGTIRAASKLAGSLPITLGETGALGAASKIAGLSTIVFGETGAFSAGFAGSTTITFNQSGSFQAGISGSTSITFSAIADFVAGFVYSRPGARPIHYEFETLRWGCLQAYPEKVFDFILETEPRERPAPSKPLDVPLAPVIREPAPAPFVAILEAPQDVDLKWDPLHGYARSLLKQVQIDIGAIQREKRRIATKFADAAAEHDKELIKAYLAKKGITKWA